MISLPRPGPSPVHPADHDRPLTGIVYKITSVMTLAMMSSLIKWLGEQDFPTGQIMFYRSLFALVPVMIAASVGNRLDLLRTKRIDTHATRSLVGVFGMYCTFSGLTMIPLATAVAITFAAPLFIVVMAVLLLGERVRLYRWSAVAVGLIGVCIMIGPSMMAGGTSLMGASFSLMGAALTAFAMITIRRMSAHEHSITITFYFSATCAVAGALTAFWGWEPQNTAQTCILILTGLLGGVGQLLLSLSFRYAEASVIAPLEYTNMIWATLIGYFAFSELPTATTWIGAAIVIASGLLILWRENRRRIIRPEPL